MVGAMEEGVPGGGCVIEGEQEWFRPGALPNPPPSLHQRERKESPAPATATRQETFMVLPGRRRPSSLVLNSAGSAAWPTSACMRKGSALTTTAFAVWQLPSSSSTPSEAPPEPPLRSTAATGAEVWMRAPAWRAAVLSAWVTAPMPPLITIHVPSEPGSRHCGDKGVIFGGGDNEWWW